MAKTADRTGASPFAHLLALVTGNKSTAEKPAEDPAQPAPEDDKPEDDEESDLVLTADDEAEDEDAAEDEDKQALGYQNGLIAGAAAERARCKAIFSAEAAGQRPDLAATLAFDSDQTAEQAVNFLNAAALPVTKPGKRDRLGERMSARRDPEPNPGNDPAKPTFAEQAAAVAKKVGL